MSRADALSKECRGSVRKYSRHSVATPATARDARKPALHAVSTAGSTARSFPIREGLRARFEAAFHDVLHHTNSAPPATLIDNTSLLGVLSTAQTAENVENRTG